MALIGDFLKALGQMTDRRFAWVLAKALGLTIGLLLAVSWIAGWLAGFIPTDLGTWPLIGDVSLPTAGLQGLAIGAVLLASAFLMIPVAALFVGIFLNEIADAVEARHYPDLPQRRPASFKDSLIAALGFTGVLVLVNLLALIVYLFSGPFAPLVFYAVNGYLLGREYFQLVAERHLPGAEAASLRKANTMRTWLAGTLMAIPLTIPVMNLLIPMLGVATITHQFHRLHNATPPASSGVSSG